MSIVARQTHTPVADPTSAPLGFATKLTISAVLILWFGLAAVAGATGLLTAPPNEPFRPVLLSVLVPIVVFLAIYAGSPQFRGFVLSRDIRIATMLQSWRVVGFGFLLLYSFDALPGLFAWPAGLGDVAVGLTAPLVVLALTRRPEFARSSTFVAWNLLGLFDFVVAAAVATLASGAFPYLGAGPVTSAPMEVWPLSLFPSFFVPLFVFVHLTVLFQVWAARKTADRPFSSTASNHPQGA